MGKVTVQHFAFLIYDTKSEMKYPLTEAVVVFQWTTKILRFDLFILCIFRSGCIASHLLRRFITHQFLDPFTLMFWFMFPQSLIGSELWGACFSLSLVWFHWAIHTFKTVFRAASIVFHVEGNVPFFESCLPEALWLVKMHFSKLQSGFVMCFSQKWGLLESSFSTVPNFVQKAKILPWSTVIPPFFATLDQFLAFGHTQRR